MPQPDTVRLLRECDQGIRMGIDSLDEAMDHAKNAKMRQLFLTCRKNHEDLRERTHQALSAVHQEGKSPNLMAKSMSWLKTNVMLSVKDNDATVADLVSEGCDMGVRSLSRYLNQYPAADDNAKSIARQLIDSESALSASLREFL